MKITLLHLSLSALALCACTSNAPKAETGTPELKPRLVVMTDIGPADVEPDDNESAVRLLSYADRFEIEALITSIGWNCDPYPDEWAEYLSRVVDGYAVDVHNLMKRSGQTDFLSNTEEDQPQALGYWPSANYIRSRVMMGSQRAGIGVIGPDNDTEGSHKIIQLLDEDDPRPIYFCAWGGANTLAQAIWRIQQERTEDELRQLLNKVHLYTITDQDMQFNMRMNRAYSSHQWLRREFAHDMTLIWDESAWLNQNELGKQSWEQYVSFIQNHGEMGKVYPTFLWGVEGDTPSFLHCMPNGLNDPCDPTQVGWGGIHEFGLAPDSLTKAWTNWEQPLKDVSDAYEKRFYPAEFRDFAARMQWAAEGCGTTNPIIILNGDRSVKPLRILAQAGQQIVLDASQTYDAEGDALTFSWWQQTEGGHYGKSLTDSTSTSSAISLTIPADAVGQEIHIVCEVHDNSPFELVSYRRIIIITQ